MTRTADDFRLDVSDMLRITRRSPRRALSPRSVAEVFAHDRLCPSLRVRVISGQSVGSTGTLISSSPHGWRIQLDDLRIPPIIKATDLHPVIN
jgi:hypothetical protein